MIDRARTWNTTSDDYLMLQNGQMVRKTPKLKGKAAVKAHRKARRKAWRQLQGMKRLALAYPDSEVARHMANAEAQFGVEVRV